VSDPEAEKAIRKTMTRLAAEGKPVDSTSVPSVASAQLLVYGGSRLNAHERIAKEIDDMKRRGDLIAPDDPPGKDWQLTKP
jgi:hypothetical protein